MMANKEQLERLVGKGDNWRDIVNSWNSWRSQNPSVAIDLREANLFGEILCGIDLSGADLFRVNLRGANVSRANFFKSNLGEAQFRHTSFQGTCFEGASLRAAYLRGANLCGSELSSAFLAGADLRNADLSRANLANADLSRCQATGANFSHALLTGACIANWHVNSSTRFDDVQANYIYRGYSEEIGNLGFINRYPTARFFEAGEFSDLIQKTIQVSDLLFEPVSLAGVKDGISGTQTEYQGRQKSTSIFINNFQGTTFSGNFANQLNDNSSQNYTVEQQEKLTEIAEESQALLEQLSQTCPSETLDEKMQLGKIAANQAQAITSLRKRLLSALEAGTIGAIAQILNHPAAAFFIEAVKDWNQSKPQA